MARDFTIASGETVDLPADDSQETHLYFADAQSAEDFSFEQTSTLLTITVDGATVTLPLNSYQGDFYTLYIGSPDDQPISLGTLRLYDSTNTASATVDSSGNYVGSSSNDIMLGRPVRDVVLGNLGDDLIYGYGGNDNLNGKDGHDIIYGGAGVDTLRGGDDNDRVYGGAEGDNIFGGDGNDEIYGGGGE